MSVLRDLGLGGCGNGIREAFFMSQGKLPLESPTQNKRVMRYLQAKLSPYGYGLTKKLSP